MLYGALNPKDLIGTVWLAHYTSKTDYAGNYEFWQCTSSGYVDGIPTENVDLDYWFDSGTTDAMPFADVALDRWSYQDVLKAYELGLIKGITATTFVPHGTASRGQVATMLYRMSGSPRSQRLQQLHGSQYELLPGCHCMGGAESGDQGHGCGTLCAQ